MVPSPPRLSARSKSPAAVIGDHEIGAAQHVASSGGRRTWCPAEASQSSASCASWSASWRCWWTTSSTQPISSPSPRASTSPSDGVEARSRPSRPAAAGLGQQEELDVAVAPGDRRADDRLGAGARPAERLGDLAGPPPPSSPGPGSPPAPGPPPPGRPRTAASPAAPVGGRGRRRPHQGGRHRAQGDERQVGHDQRRRARRWRPGSRWRTLQRSRTTTRGSWRSRGWSWPWPTSTAHDLARAPLQQAVGEPAGRGAGVERPAGRATVEPEPVEGGVQLLAAPAHEAGGRDRSDARARRRRPGGGPWRPGRPPTSTWPAPTSARAWSRDDGEASSDQLGIEAASVGRGTPPEAGNASGRRSATLPGAEGRACAGRPASCPAGTGDGTRQCRASATSTRLARSSATRAGVGSTGRSAGLGDAREHQAEVVVERHREAAVGVGPVADHDPVAAEPAPQVLDHGPVRLAGHDRGHAGGAHDRGQDGAGARGSGPSGVG